MQDLGDSPNCEQDTKTKIFQVAARLIAEKGYNGVSMREISEQSGVSKPTIYYYYKSKEEIYKELVNVGLTYVFEMLKEIEALDMPFKARLVQLMKKNFRLCLKHPDFTKFFFSLFTFADAMPFLRKFALEVEENGKILSAMIQKGIDAGEFGASANPVLAAEIIGGVLAHFIWRQLNSDKVILTDKLAEDVVEILFKGLNE
jgi:AcrR family transcriptional regulator